MESSFLASQLQAASRKEGGLQEGLATQAFAGFSCLESITS